MIAVNNNYAKDDVALQPSDEIALIPPVSGG
jgi:molybdopterin synthase sulfur carrier subunit